MIHLWLTLKQRLLPHVELVVLKANFAKTQAIFQELYGARKNLMLAIGVCLCIKSKS